jgi:glutathione S-transferase
MITFWIALAPEGRLDLESYPAVTGWVSQIQALPDYMDMPGMWQGA